MSAGVEFSAASVRQHAAALSTASDQMAQVRAAAGEVTMDAQAYGQLCQFLPALLSPLFGNAIEVLNEAVSALDETALSLRTTVSAMAAADAGSACRLGSPEPATLELPL